MKISWLGSNGLTINPGIYGCTPAGAACDHCYAARMARRLVTMTGTAYHAADTAGTIGHRIVDVDGWTGTVLVDPIAAARARIRAVPRCRTGRRRVFVTSMGDMLHAAVPTDWIVGCLEEMALRTDVDWMVLTKRGERWPEVARRWEDSDGLFGPSWPSNIWPGVTVWDQKSANRIIPYLLQVPGGVRWVSEEPMLGLTDFRAIPLADGDTLGEDLYSDCDRAGIGWVICGGENGPGARPMDPAWVRSLRDQCQAAGVPFHFKGWGEWDWGCHSYDPTGCSSPCRARVGRAASGRLLDGRTWEESPCPA